MDQRPRLLAARVVLDVENMQRAAEFWCAALGYVVAASHDTFWSIKDPAGKRQMRLGFQPKDGVKPAVNSLHFEFFTDDMEREAKRLEALGATRVKGWPYGDDEPNWIVLRDLDGHEFCVCEIEDVEYP
ncbi:MAG TPA: VOC family protein [Candidatus Thermoplasmatota archaeon]|nr:VOC family protein [Candidatus Thermoplasmatota archaeon]